MRFRGMIRESLFSSLCGESLSCHRITQGSVTIEERPPLAPATNHGVLSDERINM